MSSPVAGEADREASEESSEASFYIRPNKWHGAPSTWRAYTQEERMLASSLVQLRDRDLSVHLFNAHAMKRRLYDPKAFSDLKPWAPKESWQRKPDTTINDEISEFVPPKSWTAWPLLPEFVPRTKEQVGPEDGRDEYTFRSREKQIPSSELEDILIGTTLRYAKEIFEARQRDPSIIRQIISNEVKPPQDEVEARQEEANAEPQTVVKEEEATHTESVEKPKGTSFEQQHMMTVDDVTEFASKSDASREDQADSDSDSVAEETQKPDETITQVKADESSNEPLDPPGEPKIRTFRPIVSADDERSARLLHPTVRHTLSKLDELLTALHHARQTCLNYASDASDTQNEAEIASQVDSQGDFMSEEPPQLPSKQRRPRGRPRKELNLNSVSPEKDEEELPERTSNRGRKRHVHEPLEGESHQEMLFRIARLQKKPLPFTSSSPSLSRSRSRSGRSSSRKRRSSVDSISRRNKRLNTRDWSEVLGTAALVGFPQEAVQRAIQRCATLFGEGMTLRSFVEKDGPESYEDEIINFTPEPIPNFEDMTDDSDEASYNTPQSKLFGRRRPKRRKSEDDDIFMDDKPVVSKRVKEAAFWCPFTDCARHIEGFSQSSHLKSHLRRAHKLDDEEAKNAMDGHDDMDGGVHTDGFLKPLRSFGRGVDQAQRIRSRSGSRGVKINESDDEKKDDYKSDDDYYEASPEN